MFEYSDLDSLSFRFKSSTLITDTGIPRLMLARSIGDPQQEFIELPDS